MSNEATEQEFISWKVLYYDEEHNLLSSPSQHADWRPQEPFQVYCAYAHDLRNMEYEKCGCGIYSRKEIDKNLLAYDGYKDQKTPVKMHGVLAQLVNWGWVFEAAQGFRSQKAYPKNIIVKSNMPESFQELLRDRYQVPVVVNDDAWGVLEGKKPTYNQQALLQNLTQAQYQKALIAARRQAQYRNWYNRRKAILKRLEQMKAALARLPADIRYNETILAALEKEGPYGNG